MYTNFITPAWVSEAIIIARRMMRQPQVEATINLSTCGSNKMMIAKGNG
jgi:hypothetical protein